MQPSSTPARQTSPGLLSQDLDLEKGETREFDVDGRVVTIHGTGTDVTVISSQGKAVVIRRQPGDRFIVTGASAHHHPSGPLGREDAITLAVTRLER